jgi:hypothetical protein
MIKHLIVLIVIQAISTLDLFGEISDRIVDAVGYAESRNTPGAVGDNGSALSAFQIWRSAWDDANAFRIEQGLRPISRSRWNNHSLAREICRSCLALIESRLIKAGVKPTPSRLYLCYTMGFSGAKKIGFDPIKAPAIKRKGLARFSSFLSHP